MLFAIFSLYYIGIKVFKGCPSSGELFQKFPKSVTVWACYAVLAYIMPFCLPESDALPPLQQMPHQGYSSLRRFHLQTAV